MRVPYEQDLLIDRRSVGLNSGCSVLFICTGIRFRYQIVTPFSANANITLYTEVHAGVMAGPFRGLWALTLTFVIANSRYCTILALRHSRLSQHEGLAGGMSLLPSCLQLEHATTEHQLAHLRDLIQVGTPGVGGS